MFSQVAAGACVVLGAFLEVTHYKMLQYYEVFTVSLAAQKWEIKAVKAGDELNDPMMSVVGNVSLSNVSHGEMPMSVCRNVRMASTCSVVPVVPVFRYLCLISMQSVPQCSL